MQVLVTGGTGYLGQAVSEALIRRRHTVTVVARHCPPKDSRVQCRAIDMRTASFTELFRGTDVIVHLVGIIQEHPAAGITFQVMHEQVTQHVVDAALSAGVPRLVHMSALGTREGAISQYHQTKWNAEQYVRNAPLAWTILRPSLLFGGGSPFFATLAAQARLPLVPVPGSGQTLFQPIARTDVAEVIVQMVEKDVAVHETWEMGGPDRYTMDALYRHVAHVNGRKNPPLVHIPLPLLMLMAEVGQRIPKFPVSTDQLRMLNEANITQDERWRQLVPIAQTLGNDL